ncbi:putative Protein of unknown function (DUF667) [Blattamonas nauphoetae]|uniref:CFA20 domain-containing protein n=1 Tax=Blattamonas nauphoetae TaxID=2049346 RepID=A0ABQ9XXA7_9EUKA|nr:putative Protein of unknown function (DUF667) [Blattamonas nauphoetae]
MSDLRNSLSGSFQGGPYMDLVTAQGKGSDGQFTYTGTMKKEYNKSIKSNEYIFTGSNLCKFNYPKGNKPLNLQQPFLVFQINIPTQSDFTILLNVTDLRNRKLRLHFSAANKIFTTHQSQAHIPLINLPRGEWIHLVLFVPNFFMHFFRETFLSIDTIELSSSFHLRRIFTLKSCPPPPDPESLIPSGVTVLEPIPKTLLPPPPVNFPVHIYSVQNVQSMLGLVVSPLNATMRSNTDSPASLRPRSKRSDKPGPSPSTPDSTPSTHRATTSERKRLEMGQTSEMSIPFNVLKPEEEKKEECAEKDEEKEKEDFFSMWKPTSPDSEEEDEEYESQSPPPSNVPSALVPPPKDDDLLNWKPESCESESESEDEIRVSDTFIEGMIVNSDSSDPLSNFRAADVLNDPFERARQTAGVSEEAKEALNDFSMMLKPRYPGKSND